MSDRKLVKDKFDCLNWSVEGKDVSEVIAHLKKEQDYILNDPKYIRAEIAFYPSYDDYSYRDSDKEYWYVVGIREENDKEYSDRIAHEEIYRKRCESLEQLQLIALKKKYENKA